MGRIDPVRIGMQTVMTGFASNERANFSRIDPAPIPRSPADDFAFRMNDLAPPALLWKIRAGYRYSGPYPTKRKALQVAIDFAERDGQAGREAQVLVQGEDRVFRPAWTYGRDPYPVETPASAGSTLSAGSTAKSG